MAFLKVRSSGNDAWYTVGAFPDRVYQSDSAPTTTYAGMLWHDTDDTLSLDNVDTNYTTLQAKVLLCLDNNGAFTTRDSFNVTSCTDNGVGDFTVTFDVDFANTNYYCVGSCEEPAVGTPTQFTPDLGGKATGTIRLTCWCVTSAILDSDNNMVVIFGDQ